MTVVITDEKPATQNFLAPKSVIPDVGAPGSSPASRLAPGEPFRWQPQLSPTGPITILVSAADQRMLVVRNGIVIGRARVEIATGKIAGTRAAEFTGLDPSGREKWFAIGLPGREGEQGQALDIATQRDILIPPDFYKNLIDALAPGATLVLTDGSILGGGEGTKVEVLESM